MIWHWPQITYTIFIGLATLLQIYAATQKKQVVDAVLGLTFFLVMYTGILVLLYFGGFWAGAKS